MANFIQNKIIDSNKVNSVNQSTPRLYISSCMGIYLVHLQVRIGYTNY